MKKITALCLCMILLTAAGCGGEAGHNVNQNKGVEAVLQSGMDAANAAESGGDTAPAESAAKQTMEAASVSPAADVDVDLTILSSSLIYAEVFNMQTKPDDYIGKRIRMAGAYTTLYSEEKDTRYHSCIIKDAAACCASGIEFVLAGDPAYPDAYPKEEDFITVVGVYDIYYEGEYFYCTLREAVFE